MGVIEGRFPSCLPGGFGGDCFCCFSHVGGHAGSLDFLAVHPSPSDGPVSQQEGQEGQGSQRGSGRLSHKAEDVLGQ